jgi:DNA-binding CsgD family transcriptional regulator
VTTTRVIGQWRVELDMAHFDGAEVTLHLADGTAVGRATSLRAARDPLSGRERDVLRLLALGHTNVEIAARLVLSVRTVEMHRMRIARKLGRSTRAELVRWALERGLAP